MFVLAHDQACEHPIEVWDLSYTYESDDTVSSRFTRRSGGGGAPARALEWDGVRQGAVRRRCAAPNRRLQPRGVLRRMRERPRRGLHVGRPRTAACGAAMGVPRHASTNCAARPRALNNAHSTTP